MMQQQQQPNRMIHDACAELRCVYMLCTFVVIVILIVGGANNRNEIAHIEASISKGHIFDCRLYDGVDVGCKLKLTCYDVHKHSFFFRYNDEAIMNPEKDGYDIGCFCIKTCPRGDEVTEATWMMT